MLLAAMRGSLVTLLLCVGLSGCEGPPFIALGRDFDGFEQWESFPLGWAPGLGVSHPPGDRTVYLSRRPPKGSRSFPIGTRIVKTVAGNERIFAMAKRGGDYNADGAVGWEWFGLAHTPNGLAIEWRGLGPPSSESYAGDAHAGCNSCHIGSAANDYVHPVDLDLSKL
jgi:hypothetical protein